MFVGHYGVGLAARAKTPRISLGTWFLAVQFLDLLWPIFLLPGRGGPTSTGPAYRYPCTAISERKLSRNGRDLALV
jgi:hypothetical protein